MTDWNDNAKAAAREFAAYIGQSDKCERYLEAFETKKTVADAVEFCKGLWPVYACDNIHYDHETGHYFCNDEPKPHYQLVCTREQFEAYVKEQEGEKWTHLYGSDKCYIKESEPDWQGYIVIYSEADGYQLVEPRELKPIKQTISAKEVINMMSGSAFASWTVSDFMQHLRDDFELEG